MEYEDSELFNDEILNRKYQSVNPKQVIDEQNYLNQDQKQLLYHVLSNTDLYLTGNWDITPLQGFTFI